MTGIFRAKYPGHDIIMAADNDRFTEGNPGVAKARAAALQHGGLLAIPEFKKPAGTDYNDLYCLEGQEAVCESLAAAITP